MSVPEFIAVQREKAKNAPALDRITTLTAENASLQADIDASRRAHFLAFEDQKRTAAKNASLQEEAAILRRSLSLAREERDRAVACCAAGDKKSREQDAAQDWKSLYTKMRQERDWALAERDEREQERDDARHASTKLYAELVSANDLADRRGRERDEAVVELGRARSKGPGTPHARFLFLLKNLQIRLSPLSFELTDSTQPPEVAVLEKLDCIIAEIHRASGSLGGSLGGSRQFHRR